MQFGRHLHQHQIAEWASSYLDYDALKGKCKTITIPSTDAPKTIYIVAADETHRVKATCHAHVTHSYCTYELVQNLGLHRSIVCNEEDCHSTLRTASGLELPIVGNVQLTWLQCAGDASRETRFVVLDSQDCSENNLVHLHISNNELEDLVLSIENELKKVEDHFQANYALAHAKALAKALASPAQDSPFQLAGIDLDELDPVETEDLLWTTIEFWQDLKKLQWYGKVNRDGFRKILVKIQDLAPNILDRLQDRLKKLDFSLQTCTAQNVECAEQTIAALRAIVPHQSPCFSNRVYSFVPFLQELEATIENDFASVLAEIMQRIEIKLTAKAFSALRVSALHRSTLSLRPHCIRMLMPKVDRASIVYFLHRYIRMMGREKRSRASESTSHLPKDRAYSVKTFVSLLKETPLDLLFKLDSFGNSILHVAAEHNLPRICQIICKTVKDWDPNQDGSAKKALWCTNLASNTPLHLAVLGGHVPVMKSLLECLQSSTLLDQASSDFSFLGNLFLLACKSGSLGMVKALCAINIDTNHVNQQGDTALCIAAMSGHQDVAQLLLREGRANIDLPNPTSSRTPLIIASANGNLSMVRLLLSAGANQAMCDDIGWTAKDHAAFRGHITIAKMLYTGPDEPCFVYKRPLIEEAEDLRIHKSKPLDLAGKFPSSKTQIIINLGSHNNKNAIVVDLSPTTSKGEFCSYPETAFAVRVSAIGASGSRHTFQLPILESLANKPHFFSTNHLESAMLLFEILRISTDPAKDDASIGSGILVLKDFNQQMGKTRESLIRDHTVPILSREDFSLLAIVTFNVVIVKPTMLPDDPPTRTDVLWSNVRPAGVVGHRGSGQNVGAKAYLQIGENTAQSFLSAVKLGAAYVETDVQLTKDHVPVIYHDFLVSESGFDLPMHALTLDQLMHISEAQSHIWKDIPALHEARYLEKTSSLRKRSHSICTYDTSRETDFKARIAHTLEYKIKTFKGNTRGSHIHQPFITFEALLKDLPQDIPLNVEVKYPMLSEATDEWAMDLSFPELNLFVHTILRTLSQHSGTRPMLLTAFNPSICILLKLAQTRYPVLFCNDSGNWPAGDDRAKSLQGAIKFAKAWGLDGIVMASEPFVLSPKLVGRVRDAGLVGGSYGKMNDSVDTAKIQSDAGLNFLIVDRIRLISEALRGSK